MLNQNQLQGGGVYFSLQSKGIQSAMAGRHGGGVLALAVTFHPQREECWCPGGFLPFVQSRISVHRIVLATFKADLPASIKSVALRKSNTDVPGGLPLWWLPIPLSWQIALSLRTYSNPSSQNQPSSPRWVCIWVHSVTYTHAHTCTLRKRDMIASR